MINFVNLLVDATANLDKKTITFFVVLMVILFIGFAGIGTLIHISMKHQASRVDSYMYHVYSANLVTNPSEFRRYALKKNLRVLFKQSLLPFLFMFIGLMVWLIVGWVTSNFEKDIFVHCKDLFIIYDFGNEDYYTYVFGVKLLASWPAKINEPHIETEHIFSYIEGFFFSVGFIYYMVSCQAFISRFIYAGSLGKELYKPSLINIKEAKEKAALNVMPNSNIGPVD